MKTLAEVGLVALLLMFLVLFLHEIRTSPDTTTKGKDVTGIVYLLSSSGRVQISDFQGIPYVHDGYNTWFDKKNHKHWTKAPLMYVQNDLK